MTIAHNKIIAKIQTLEEYLRYLKELQKINRKSFFDDYHFYGSTEHYLHLSIEILLDISKLIIIHYGFPRPEEPQDAFRILFEKKVLNEKLYEKLTGIANFRNILVHEYEKVNRDIIYDALQNKIEQFQNFKKQILRFLKKN